MQRSYDKGPNQSVERMTAGGRRSRDRGPWADAIAHEHQPGPADPADCLAEIERLLLADDVRVFRIVFRDSDVFRLRTFSPIDSSIYDAYNQWSATIVEPIRARHPNFARLFSPGTGLDFIATDIAQIIDDTGVVLYSAPSSSDVERNSSESGNS